MYEAVQASKQYQKRSRHNYLVVVEKWGMGQGLEKLSELGLGGGGVNEHQ